jgi:hypothetical protein
VSALDQALAELPLRLSVYPPELAAEVRSSIVDLLADGLVVEVPPLDDPIITGSAERDELPERSPRLIAVCGRARSGKDLLASYCEEHYAGVARLAYSDPIIAEANVYLERLGRPQITEANKVRPAHRQLLQAWGLARRAEDPAYWTRQLERRIGELQRDGARLVIVSGARVDSDLEPIRALGGQVWKVVRPNSPFHNEHRLEQAIDELPYERLLVNGTEGDPAAFFAAISEALAEG